MIPPATFATPSTRPPPRRPAPTSSASASATAAVTPAAPTTGSPATARAAGPTTARTTARASCTHQGIRARPATEGGGVFPFSATARPGSGAIAATLSLATSRSGPCSGDRKHPTASVEASALTHPGVHGHVRGPTPFLRIQSDERLVALTRRGNQAGYEALVRRYQSRLLAFCRHMLGSREDAEDVLQEVFAAAFNAMMADDRALNVRPWLYRIARNRSLNHLRRATAIGVDSMDVHLSEHGQSAADKVHRREEFRLLVQDVQELAETQRTALLLREIDALSYEQIAEAMETTIPSVKSLLVRARVSLAEAAEARTLTCAEVRGELGAVAEGLARTTAPVRRHLRSCA